MIIPSSTAQKESEIPAKKLEEEKCERNDTL